MSKSKYSGFEIVQWGSLTTGSRWTLVVEAFNLWPTGSVFDFWKKGEWDEEENERGRDNAFDSRLRRDYAPLGSSLAKIKTDYYKSFTAQNFGQPSSCGFPTLFAQRVLSTILVVPHEWTLYSKKKKKTLFGQIAWRENWWKRMVASTQLQWRGFVVGFLLLCCVQVQSFAFVEVGPTASIPPTQNESWPLWRAEWRFTTYFMRHAGRSSGNLRHPLYIAVLRILILRPTAL